jgi:hypothetical protein
MCWPRPTDPDVLIFFPNSAPRLAQFPPLIPAVCPESVSFQFILCLSCLC